MDNLIEPLMRLWGGWGILVFSTVTGVVAQLSLKHLFITRQGFLLSFTPLHVLQALADTWQLWLYGACAAASLVSWLLVVRRFELNMAFPVVQSLSFVLILILSSFLFREILSATRLVGVGIICLGIFLCSR